MDNVIVTQADREAAATAAVEGQTEKRTAILRGDYDKSEAVKAFARHRTEATRQLEADKAELVEALRCVRVHAENNLKTGKATQPGFWSVGLKNCIDVVDAALTKHGGNHDAD